ncbi:hypothetical protein C8R47DRAFT_1283386 [Mycena vitilis]|nr:hypothetical protein C8R47DRAFT_1073650 [Mycena vitilis]KAJ6482042.1 hypothetical protein C8R47DRAFT_1283386 [Mycena vitilis]
MDSSAAPKPKGSHGGRRAGSGRKKKEEVLGQSPQNAARVARNPPRTLGLPLRTAPRFINPAAPAPFFAPYNTNQPVPLGSQTTQTGRATFYAALGTSRTGLAGENTINGSAASSANGSNQTNISQAEFAQLTDQLEYIEEHDEHADIASGDRVINDSLIDEVLDSTEADAPAEAETHSSEPGKESALHKWFVSVRDRLSIEIKKYKSPLCYQRGDFYDRAPHPVFALQWSMKRNTELDPSELYPHDVFVWIPNLLPGAPNRFKCTCGKPLSRNGWNDDPIARRVRSIPADFFLLTNRFLCNPRRADPGCGTSYQGTDPHVIAQLPAFVQPAFPAYISSRGAISKVVMWQMCNTFSTRFGPSPFSQMVSEVQHRHHADGELMYLAAVLFFGRRGCKQFSKFDDREGYAGSPPSVPWLKALFTDFMAAHRIYIERYIGTLPLTISKADHTFDFLKYMSSLKGERIFSAAYTVLNEFEEVRAHALTQTKSLAVVEEMFEGIQEGLKNSNNPPTQILYTDSPQGTHLLPFAHKADSIPAERSFHESINRSLSHNVVAVNAWTDLPPFVRCQGIQTVIVSDSVDIENAASDVLEDLVNVSSSSSPLYLVAIAIKTDQHPGEPVRLDIIQLRTQDKIYVFRVSNLTARSDVLPSLRAILTNSSIIKIGHSVRQTLQIIAQVFSLTDLMNILKTRTPPILDLGKYAKLKGVLDDPSASFSALAGVVLRNSFSIPQFSPYPWSGTTSPQQNELLFSEIDCHWQVYLSLRARNSIGLPLQPIQAQTHGELVTLVLACKPIAEGSIVGKHSGFLDAVMDTQGHTTRISISRTRSLVQLSKVLVPGALHKLHEQTMEWIWNHGGLVVVTTSQLHTRGEIAPTPAGALARAFSVPAPPPLLDDTEFPITYESPDSQSLTSTQFEHRTESMPSYGGEDESDSDEDSGTGEDGRSRFVFEVEPHRRIALDEPISFDLTSGRPVAGNDAFDALTSFDSTGEHPAEDDSLDMNDLIEWEASLAPTTATIPPLVFPSNPPLRQIEQQMRLPGAPETVPRKSKKAKRCAPCVKAYCRRRNKCNGRGGKDLCNCIPPHPKMAPGERARIPEEVIEAYLAQQDQNILFAAHNTVAGKKPETGPLRSFAAARKCCARREQEQRHAQARAAPQHRPTVAHGAGNEGI